MNTIPWSYFSAPYKEDYVGFTPYPMSDADMTNLLFGANTSEHLSHRHESPVTTSWWEEEQTFYYQIQVKGFCITRRHGESLIVFTLA